MSSSVGLRVMLCGLVACGMLAATQNARADEYTHDGFYLQMATGLGYYSSSADAGGAKMTFSGATVPFSIMIGGSPIKGLAVGGGMMIDYAPSPGFSYKVNGQDYAIGDISVHQYLLGFGPFVDFYPNPKTGLHFQGFVGWGGLETSANGNVGGSDPTGLLTALGGGYDFWVGSQWSIGVLGRFTFAPLSLNGVGYTTIEPALLASFTYY